MIVSLLIHVFLTNKDTNTECNEVNLINFKKKKNKGAQNSNIYQLMH